MRFEIRYIVTSGFPIHDLTFQRFTQLQELRFVLRSFLSSVCRSAKARNGLTEK